MRALTSVRDFWRRKGPASRKEGLLISSIVAAVATMLILVALFGGPCSEGDSLQITYENRTDHDVAVLLDGGVEITLRAGETRQRDSYLADWSVPRLVEAVDERTGLLLFSVALNRDDLRRQHNYIVIIETSPSP